MSDRENIGGAYALCQTYFTLIIFRKNKKIALKVLTNEIGYDIITFAAESSA